MISDKELLKRCDLLAALLRDRADNGGPMLEAMTRMRAIELREALGEKLGILPPGYCTAMDAERRGRE